MVGHFQLEFEVKSLKVTKLTQNTNVVHPDPVRSASIGYGSASRAADPDLYPMKS
jgi:hypothetical protein